MAPARRTRTRGELRAGSRGETGLLLSASSACMQWTKGRARLESPEVERRIPPSRVSTAQAAPVLDLARAVAQDSLFKSCGFSGRKGGTAATSKGGSCATKLL